MCTPLTANRRRDYENNLFVRIYMRVVTAVFSEDYVCFVVTLVARSECNHRWKSVSRHERGKFERSVGAIF